MSSLPDIAIFGGFCAGKSTLAANLQRSYGYRTTSLSGKIKSLVKEAYGTDSKSDVVTLTSEDGVEFPCEVRRVFQLLGEKVREVDRDFWLRFVLSEARREIKPLVVDDGRMPHEASELRKRGWVTIRLWAPLGERMERYNNLYGHYPSVAVIEHHTEKLVEQCQVDREFISTQEPETLLEQVTEFIHEVSYVSEGSKPV